MKLYIHIGSDKCGSTAIQTSLYMNRDALAAQSVYIPENGFSRYEGHDKCFTDWSGQTFYFLIDELKSIKNKYATAIISWEGIHFIPKSRLYRRFSLLRDFDAVALYYVRDQAEIIQTGILQQWKTDNCPVPFIKQTPANRDYFNTAELWSAFLGQPSEVALFQRNLFEDGDVVTDFYTRVGVRNISQLRKTGKDMNDSLAFESALLLSYLDRLFPIDQPKRTFLVDALLSVQKEFSLSKYFLSEEDVDAIRQHYKESNHALEKKYQLSSVNTKNACWNNAEGLMTLHSELLLRTLALYDIPVFNGGNVAGHALNNFFKSGWWPTEVHGAWAYGGRSVIKFRIMRSVVHNVNKPLTDVTITIKGRYFQHVEKISGLSVNGSAPKKVDLSNYSFTLPIEEIPKHGIIEFVINHFQTASPYDLNLSNDERQLSLSIEAISLTKGEVECTTSFKKITILPEWRFIFFKFLRSLKRKR